MKKCTESEIVRMIRSGNERQENEAISCVFEMHGRTLTKFIASRVSANCETAPVLWSVITFFFEKVKAKGFQLEKEGAILRYLFTVAKFRCKEELRSKEVSIDWEENGKEEMTEGFIKNWEEEELKACIQGKIVLLSTRCQEVIRMVYYQGMRHKDIAETLGFRSVQVSKNTLHRCLKKLRFSLKGSECEDLFF